MRRNANAPGGRFLTADRLQAILVGCLVLLCVGLGSPLHGQKSPPALVAADPVRKVVCPATRDVWLSSVDGETDFNMGSTPKLKLKIWQEFALVDFDVRALEGYTVDRAFLHIKPAGGHRLGLNGGTDLRWLTVSTVTHDWVEGLSRRNGTDTHGKGATFRESSYGTATWGWPGSRIWDVILGNGNSVRFDGMLDPAEDLWLRMELEPRIVEALIAGSSHGLALMDGSTDVHVNCLIKSRESGEGPFLEVYIGRRDGVPPKTPFDLEVEPLADMATPTRGAARIRVRVPTDTFSWRVRVNGKALEPWQIPLAKQPDDWQSLPLLDLSPDSQVRVEVAAVDAAGGSSAYASAVGRSSAELLLPDLPPTSFRPAGGAPPSLGSLRVWAMPAVSKLDPLTGRLIDEASIDDPSRRNAVWDGGQGLVRLAAARGEIVGFQLVAEGRARDCRIEISDLDGPGRIRRSAARVWRNWQVAGVPEYAIPLDGPIDIPAVDNSLTGQKVQSFTIDYFIPAASHPGEYRGEIGFRCHEGAIQLDLRVDVFDVALPDTLQFIVELNCYKGPGTAGSHRFVESFRLAHYHRATINRVPYSQRGRVHDDWTPTIDQRGRVVSWKRFDKNLGGLLDGSLFADNPRRGIPVPVLYLPLFEGWPRDYRAHYRPGTAVPSDASDRDAKLEHDILAVPIEQAFSRDYEESFKTTLKEFADHFGTRGWGQTQFQIYLNNTPKYGYSLWALDEPFKMLDWRALNYFAGLSRQVMDEQAKADLNRSTGPRIAFRADISRPMWQGSISDGLIDTLYLSDEAYSVVRLVREMKTRMPAGLHNYGHCNRIEESNWRSVAWCLDAFGSDFDGVLPWQSIGGPQALVEPSQTALIIDAGTHGVAVASLRLHALRYGAQLAELLRLLQLSRGWSRQQVAAWTQGVIPSGDSSLRGVPPGSPSAAATDLEARTFIELKEGILRLLETPPL